VEVFRNRALSAKSILRNFVVWLDSLSAMLTVKQLKALDSGYYHVPRGSEFLGRRTRST